MFCAVENELPFLIPNTFPSAYKEKNKERKKEIKINALHLLSTRICSNTYVFQTLLQWTVSPMHLFKMSLTTRLKNVLAN